MRILLPNRKTATESGPAKRNRSTLPTIGNAGLFYKQNASDATAVAVTDYAYLPQRRVRLLPVSIIIFALLCRLCRLCLS
jgi:hypothetical protein